MNTPVGRLVLRPARLLDPDVQRLVAEVQEEYVARYGGPDVSSIHGDDFEPPQGAFFVGSVGEQPVAMGGWRRRLDVHPWQTRRAAEIKRMFVVGPARGHGHARAVLTRLEESAREHGCDVLVLETGLRQPEAIGLYTSAGYRPIDGFGHYAGHELSRCFGKLLADGSEPLLSH